MSLQGRELPIGARITAITLVHGGVPDASAPRRHAFLSHQVMESLLREQPFPMDLFIWEPRDTQALGRSWRLLNQCRATLTSARPSDMWFLLHAQADGQNLLSASGSLFHGG